jgi:hypothetical protein
MSISVRRRSRVETPPIVSKSGRTQVRPLRSGEACLHPHESGRVCSPSGVARANFGALVPIAAVDLDRIVHERP